uniref:Uncharacterized protein n=1 Tax=Phlebotomus papatasi TaxID=29031 RepID=A0A1B0D8K9_PHLPP
MVYRSAAKSQGINRETLRLYWKVRGGELENTKLLKTVKPGRSSVFNEAQEAALEKYLLDCSDSYFGLTINNVRKLAFDFAHQLKISTPSSWDRKKIAGIDWFYNFRKRHPNLSLRKPEATSLQRAMGFNKTNVNKFFTQLRSLYARHFAFKANKSFSGSSTLFLL